MPGTPECAENVLQKAYAEGAALLTAFRATQRLGPDPGFCCFEVDPALVLEVEKNNVLGSTTPPEFFTWMGATHWGAAIQGWAVLLSCGTAKRARLWQRDHGVEHWSREHEHRHSYRGHGNRIGPDEEYKSLEDCIHDKFLLRRLPTTHKAAPGRHFPRMWREIGSVEGVALHQRAQRQAERMLAHLDRRLAEVFMFVEPVNQAATHGLMIRELLLLACMEVESHLKATMSANGYVPLDSKKKPSEIWRTTDYVKLKIPLKLDEYDLELTSHRDYGPVAPFGLWDAGKATQSLGWYQSYNATKHDRENALREATLDDAVNAVAAAHIMLHAQFGPGCQPPDSQFEFIRCPTFSAPEMYFPSNLGSNDWLPDLHFKEYIIPYDFPE